MAVRVLSIHDFSQPVRVLPVMAAPIVDAALFLILPNPKALLGLIAVALGYGSALFDRDTIGQVS